MPVAPVVTFVGLGKKSKVFLFSFPMRLEAKSCGENKNVEGWGGWAFKANG